MRTKPFYSFIARLYGKKNIRNKGKNTSVCKNIAS